MSKLSGRLPHVRIGAPRCAHDIGVPADLHHFEKPVANAKGKIVEKIDVSVADESAAAILSLFGIMIRSTRDWDPFSTVLLISRPNWQSTSRISINSRTILEVDPDMVEAEWLRTHAQSSVVHVNQPFPENGLPSSYCNAQGVFHGIDWAIFPTSVRCRCL